MDFFNYPNEFLMNSDSAPSFNKKLFQSRSKPSSFSNPVYAAALQDHFVKSFKLDDSLSLSQNSRLKTNFKPKRPILNQQQRLLAKWTKESKINYKSLNLPVKNSDCGDEKERVLGPHPQPLTLAQKLGIVSKPPDRLTNPQWEGIKQTFINRNDSNCPICQEQFTTQDQILLSCTHIYHKKCLESYEKYTKCKTCPMCRQQNYEKKLIFHGKNAYRHQCALKIQTWYRCKTLHRKYLKYCENNPPKDPLLLKNYNLKQMEKVTQMMQNQIIQDTLEVECFLKDLDSELNQTRKLLERGTVGYLELETNWEDVYEKAFKRGLMDVCSICIMPLTNAVKKRSLMILSCSHVFHSTCVMNMERFDVNACKACPICRSKYERMELHV